MTPRQHTYAFMIWAVSQPSGWDLTVTEAAKAAGISPQIAGRIVKLKGWKNRFRVSETDTKLAARQDAPYFRS